VIPSQPPGATPDLKLAITTLTTAGFILERVDRHPGYALIVMSRPDEFSVFHKYCFALAENNRFDETQVAAIEIPAKQFNARLVFIGAHATASPSVDWNRFLGLCGGPVFSTSPLDDRFCADLVTLGRNELPAGLTGRPDDLFEIYVRSALEFILGVRVIRYGQDRRFEMRPDGIVLPYDQLAALYDAKAYADGYPVTADSMRQFSSYVTDFRARYTNFFQLNVFIAISGRFQQQEAALRERSAELLASCGIPLTFLTADVLSGIVQAVARAPAVRRSLNWKRIFADPIVQLSRVTDDIQAVLKDGIVRTP
jgi:hypothetical protein